MNSYVVRVSHVSYWCSVLRVFPCYEKVFTRVMFKAIYFMEQISHTDWTILIIQCISAFIISVLINHMPVMHIFVHPWALTLLRTSSRHVSRSWFFWIKGSAHILRLLMWKDQLFSRKSVLCLRCTKHSTWVHLLDHHLSIFVHWLGEMMFLGCFDLHFVENQPGWMFCHMLICHLHIFFGDLWVLYSGIYFGS